MELVPIKVKIGLRANGHADHPQWSLLPMINKERDEKQHMPHGWMYDKSCGHAESRISGDGWDSPTGMQWGCLLVTEAFAAEAIATFPTLITEITEVEFEDFYNNKSRVHMTEHNYNSQLLEGLKLEYDLKVINNENVVAIKQRIAKAIDPNDSAPGILKNKDKLWVDKKVSIDVTIKSVMK
ncbi:hypothetical protein KAW18_19135 [candidate division WOR-3 bacterium]|nr:hypothetical protein [candidate division WOR-3 bacterium]